MARSLVIWTNQFVHCPIARDEEYDIVYCGGVHDFNAIIKQLETRSVKEEIQSITVCNFEAMCKEYGLEETGLLLARLGEIGAKEGYQITVLPTVCEKFKGENQYE